MKTGIRETEKGHQVWFQIDNQTFYLDPCELEDEDTYASAKFFEEQLTIAFKKLNITDVGQSFRRCLDVELNEEDGACPTQCNYCKKLPL